MKKLILCLFAATATSLSAQAVIANCDAEFYDIEGDSGNQLMTEMKSKSKVPGGFFAYTSWNIHPKCAEVTTTCKVRLPRWNGYANSQNKRLKKKWDKFFAATVAHEQGHVDIFNEAMQAARTSASGLGCAKAENSIRNAYSKSNAKEKQYDASTEHGATQGATFHDSHFQSLAYSAKTDSVGFSFDQETRKAAERRAIKACNDADCKTLIWADGANMCSSMAENSEKAYGSAYGSGRQDSEKKAKAVCAKYGKNCKIRITICAGEGEISE